MVMSGIRPHHASGDDLHVRNPETDLELRWNDRAVLQIDEKDPGICRRRGARWRALLCVTLRTGAQKSYGNNETSARHRTHESLRRQIFGRSVADVRRR